MLSIDEKVAFQDSNDDITTVLADWQIKKKDISNLAIFSCNVSVLFLPVLISIVTFRAFLIYSASFMRFVIQYLMRTCCIRKILQLQSCADVQV